MPRVIPVTFWLRTVKDLSAQQVLDKKQKAKIFLEQGKIKPARNILKKLCSGKHADAESLYLLGSICGQLGEYSVAIKNYSRVIKLQPDSIAAYAGLGSAHRQLNEYLLAEEAFQKAFELQPDNPGILLQLAQILLIAGKLDASETMLQRLQQLVPASADIFHLLAEIRMRNNQLTEAISYYEQALNLNPKRPGTCNRLGLAFQKCGDPEKAITYYKKALTIKHDFAEAQVNMGNALVAIGKMDSARNAFRDARHIQKNNIDASIGEIELDEREGDYTAAWEKLEPLVNRGIAHPGIALAFSKLCSRVGRCDQAIDMLNQLLEGNDAADADMHLHYALGKLYDSRENYSSAFEHYRQANQLEQGVFDPQEHSRRIDALIKTFDSTFMSIAPHSSCRSDRPVFIVGMPRSGTTLTEQILASHSDVFGAGELTAIMRQPEQLVSLIGSSSGYPEFLRKLDSNILDQLADNYLQQLDTLDQNAARIIDKMPVNFMHLGLIALEFPRCRIIHCHRDARDTSLSIYFQHFSATHAYASDLANIGHYYREYTRLMKHWCNVLGISVMNVSYEDIINNLESTTRNMLDFLELPWDSRCLDFHDSGRRVETISYYQVRQPIYTHAVSRWKHYEPYLAPLLKSLDSD